MELLYLNEDEILRADVILDVAMKNTSERRE
jgi:hypothetical protein